MRVLYPYAVLALRTCLHPNKEVRKLVENYFAQFGFDLKPAPSLPVLLDSRKVPQILRGREFTTPIFIQCTMNSYKL